MEPTVSSPRLAVIPHLFFSEDVHLLDIPIHIESEAVSTYPQQSQNSIPIPRSPSTCPPATPHPPTSTLSSKRNVHPEADKARACLLAHPTAIPLQLSIARSCCRFYARTGPMRIRRRCSRRSTSYVASLALRANICLPRTHGAVRTL